MKPEHILRLAVLYTRLGLGTAFLSAVADRFGLWRAPGQPGVAWGEWSRFVTYTAQLNFFVPALLLPILAGLATIAEVVLGVALLVGISPRVVGYASAALLTLFALTMTLALGIKAPLNFSVFTAAGAAFLLGAMAPAAQDAAVPRRADAAP